MSLMRSALMAAAIFAVSPVQAQYPPAWRSGTPVNTSYKFADGEIGEIMASADGLISRFKTNSPARAAQLQAPFGQTRSIAPYVASDEFLISGWNPGSSEAVIVRVKLGDWSGQPLEILGSPWVLPGVDFVDLVWSSYDGMLFVIDGISRQLEFTALPPFGPWPPAGTFTAIASEADAFGIGHFDPDWHTLLEVGPLQVELWDRTGLTHSFTFMGGQWGHTSYLRGSAVPPNFAVFEATRVNSLGPITITGPLGSFDVIDVESQQSAFTGNVSSGAWNNVSVPQGALRSGRVYEIVRTGVAPARFIALERHGSPPKVAATSLSVPVPMQDENVTGSDLFGVATAWSAGEGANLPVSGDVYLWLAVTAPGQSDPIVFVDADGDGAPDAALLVGAVAGQARQKSLTEEMTVAPVADALAIPADGTLVGTNLWFQYVLVTGGNLVLLSEVTSVPIEAGSGALVTESGEEEARSRAVRNWLATFRDAAGQRALRRIQGRLLSGR